MSDTPLTIIVITTAKPGREAALGAVQDKLVAGPLLEDGCLRYELHQSLDDGRVRIFVETWASEGEWRAHMEGAGITTGWRPGNGDKERDHDRLTGIGIESHPQSFAKPRSPAGYPNDFPIQPVSRRTTAAIYPPEWVEQPLQRIAHVSTATLPSLRDLFL